MENDLPEEVLLYEQLVGAYYSMPQVDNAYSTTDDQEQWNSLNNVIDKLVEANHQSYAELKVVPTANTNRAGRTHYEVSIATLRMKTMATLRRMGREFSCGDPGVDLSKYGSGSNFNLSQNASPSITASAHQEQSQKQEISMSIEKLAAALNAVLSESDRVKIAPILDEVYKKPTKENVSKLVSTVKALGQLSANAALGVLAETALKMAFGLPPL